MKDYPIVYHVMFNQRHDCPYCIVLDLHDDNEFPYIATVSFTNRKIKIPYTWDEADMIVMTLQSLIDGHTIERPDERWVEINTYVKEKMNNVIPD